MPGAPQTLIIGAGPAGITAANELSKHGISGTIFEADDVVGGISRTVEREGYRFDIGGHRFFSKSAEVNEIWAELLTEPMLLRPRLSRIFYGNHFYDYPLKAGNALRNLGVLEAMRCMCSYAGARIRPHPAPANFEEWVSNQFGRRLYEMFFRVYTEKVWGIPCCEIGADWAAQRIKGLSLGAAIRHALLGRRNSSVVTTLIDEFQYPRLGPGQLWEDGARKAVESGWDLRKSNRVTEIDVTGGAVRSVTCDDGSRHECTELLTSIPLRDLILGLTPQPPDEVRDAAYQLAYRDFITVALMVDAADVFPDNWIYIHASEVRMGRVQNFKNWSPAMVPDPAKTCLGIEYFCNEGDDLWNKPDDELIDLGYSELRTIKLHGGDLIGGHVVRVKKAYPVYNTGYAERLSTIRRYLSGIAGLQCVGRNGQHRYNNMDHSMMTALIAARNIAGDARKDPWAVNEDAEYHEETR